MSEYRFMSLSGRPRPVTATTTRQTWLEISNSSPLRRSLDSSGSTESLCSVLDHDSYVSLSSEEGDLGDSDVEETQHQLSDMKIEEGPLESYAHDTNTESTEHFHQKQKQNRIYASYTRSKSASPSRTRNIIEDEEFKGLSPWEKWLLIKTREERIKHKLEMRTKNLKEEEKMNEERKKREKQMKAEEEIKRWKKFKNERERAQKRLDKRLKEAEEDCKHKKESEIHEKAEKKYEEWLKTKAVEDRKKKKEEILKKKKEKEEENKRRMKAEEKFKEWCKDVKKRPKSAQNTGHSYLNDDNEINSYPEPAFCNPIPWQPIKIPRQKSDTKKSSNKKSLKSSLKSKSYTWNPAKYY
ncbi:hypothetical protein LOTGIDRAFT_238740 [Lottia gigantea]|uniref:Coiled-coil domain-containing protein n=1 Tax=Lottia gigantea TaxID=225164 RepID=V4CCR8_LOTGI|nr:hypothetical protein LOTGIDRAFT_238740 [Lottia gigantea]ESO99699.1 hypothetical protein LOTGIDRAFT_238740 [Lottia gigantea]